MSSSCRKKFLVRHPVVVDVGCSCRKTKIFSLFSSPPSKPKPNPQAPPKHHHHLSSYYPLSSSTTTATSPWETSHHPSSTTTTMTSPYEEDSSSPSSHAAVAAWLKKEEKSPKKKNKTIAATATAASGGKRSCGWGRVGESVAVVKDSDDPYLDFRDSMLQMIMEKEIYAWEDLKELLNRFLSLNSPYHHDAIVRAFAEIWNGVFSNSAAVASHPARHGHGSRRRQLQKSRDA